MLRFTTTTGAAFAVYAPPVSKAYIVWNDSGQSMTIYNSTVIGNTTAAGTGTSIISGVAYTVATLSSTTLGQWQAFFSSLSAIPTVGQTITATATGTLAGGATVTATVLIANGSKVMVWSDGTSFYEIQASNLTGTLPIANGGTGQTTANAALNALLPVQTSNANKYLQTDGTNSSWDAINLSTSDITGTLAATNGGTGQSTYTTGDTLYSSAANTLAKLAGNTTATRKYLVSVGTGTVATAPTWDDIDISTGDITGTLAVANGGTGQTAVLTQYGILYGSTTTAMATTLAGTSTQVLHGNASGAPTWGSVALSADVSGTLPIANGGTGQTTANAALNALLPAQTNSRVLRSNGTDTSFAQVALTTDISGTLPIANGGTNSTATPTNGGITYGTGTAQAYSLVGTSGQILSSNAAAAPTWVAQSSIAAGSATNATLATTATLATLATTATLATLATTATLATLATLATQASSALIRSATVQASTSGTSINFTGIPSGVERITVQFRGVSLNSSANFLIQLGTGSTTYTTSGYVSTALAAVSGGNTILSDTTGFLAYISSTAGVWSGHMVITNISGNDWVSSHNGKYNTGTVCSGAGDVSLSAVLTAVRITTTTGTDTFDAGSINILYE
jgi:hypothetical protein